MIEQARIEGPGLNFKSQRDIQGGINSECDSVWLGIQDRGWMHLKFRVVDNSLRYGRNDDQEAISGWECYNQKFRKKNLQYREENREKYDRSQQVAAPEAAPMSPEFHLGYVNSS